MTVHQTPSELYSDYKQSYADLENARHEVVKDEDIESSEVFRPVLETLDLEIDLHEMDPEEAGYVQELLDLRAEAQNPITKEKIYVKIVHILGAQARLNIQDIIAKDVLNENFSEYYNDAVAEDAKY